MEGKFYNMNCVFLLFIIVINGSYSLAIKTENLKNLTSEESKGLSKEILEKSTDNTQTLSRDKLINQKEENQRRNQNNILIKNNSKKNGSFIELGSTIHYVDKKYGMNFIQSKLDPSSLNLEGNYKILFGTGETHRITRFIWAIIIVVIMSLACYFIVKFSVDWATESQMELNKMKATKLEDITREINNKFMM